MKTMYLDAASTTPVFPEVVKEMEKFHLKIYGNPSSPHELGQEARRQIERARTTMAREIGAKTEEIIFTSGATESNNLIIQGLTEVFPSKKRIIISSIEHPSISEPCEYLKSKNYEVIKIKSNKEGLIDIQQLKDSINNQTLLVSIIFANNEFGSIQNIREIGQICKEKKVIFHTDATQIFSKEKINVRELNISSLSASAHKIGGPKGIGFLFLKEGIKINPLMRGGNQERSLRPGTENSPGIIGFAKAVEMMRKIDKKKIKHSRDLLMKELKNLGGKTNGSIEKRLYNNIHVSFSGKDAEIIISKLSQKGIICSTRSACSTKNKKENQILKAIGLSDREINGSIRITLLNELKKEEIDYFIKVLRPLVL